jgi:archaemetzincin
MCPNRKNKIIIVTCGRFEKETTRHIRRDISRVFGAQTDLKECDMDITAFYNPARRQYNADLLLESLSDRVPAGYMKYFSLFRGDLFIPILTYIFGQAKLNGNLGIASMFRLRNELYGLAPDKELMLERFSKVVIHEIGHMYGLIHCHNPICVMRSSTYVEDLDMKRTEFCQQCRDAIDLPIT